MVSRLSVLHIEQTYCLCTFPIVFLELMSTNSEFSKAFLIHKFVYFKFKNYWRMNCTIAIFKFDMKNCMNIRIILICKKGVINICNR